METESDDERIKADAKKVLKELEVAFPSLASLSAQYERQSAALFLRWVAELKRQKPDLENYPPAVIDAYFALSQCLNPLAYQVTLSEFKLPTGLTLVNLMAEHSTNPNLSVPVRAIIIYNEKGQLASLSEIVDAHYHADRTLGIMQDTGIQVEVVDMFANGTGEALFLEAFRQTSFAKGLEELVRRIEMPRDIHGFMPMYNTPGFRRSPTSVVFRQPKSAEDNRYRKPRSYQLMDDIARMFNPDV